MGFVAAFSTGFIVSDCEAFASNAGGSAPSPSTNGHLIRIGLGTPDERLLVDDDGWFDGARSCSGRPPPASASTPLEQFTPEQTSAPACPVTANPPGTPPWPSSRVGHHRLRRLPGRPHPGVPGRRSRPRVDPSGRGGRRLRPGAPRQVGDDVAARRGSTGTRAPGPASPRRRPSAAPGSATGSSQASRTSSSVRPPVCSSTRARAWILACTMTCQTSGAGPRRGRAARNSAGPE